MKRQVLGGIAIAAAAMLTLGAVAIGASASGTNAGVAVIVDSDNPNTALTTGGVGTLFAVKVPTGAACTGDSNNGYSVTGYLTDQSDPENLTFSADGPAGTGTTYPLIDASHSSYIGRPVNPGTGVVVPTGALTLTDFDISTLPAGTYHVGLACVRASGGFTMDKYWDTQITFTASAQAPGGFVWQAPNTSTPSTSTTTVATTTSSTPASTSSTSTSSTTSSSVPTSSSTTSSTTPGSTTSTTQLASVTDTVVAPGDYLTADAGGFQSGTDVKWVLNSTPIDLGTSKANASGVAVLTFQVPDTLPVGTHRLDATGLSTGGQQVTRSASFEVSTDLEDTTSTTSPTSTTVTSTTSTTSSVGGLNSTTTTSFVASNGGGVSNGSNIGGSALGATTAGSGQSLPNTGGASPVAPIIFGGMLLYVGYMVILLARRRRIRIVARAVRASTRL